MKKNSSILIIGNGESILKYDFGQKIDTYPTIARINNYKIKGYEQKVGTKTDIWINGANSKLEKKTNYPNKILTFIPSDILAKKEKNINKYVSNRLKLDNNKFEITPLNSIKNFEKKINHNRLTTGLYSILWATENYNEVIIHGFDFFINSKSHYYNSKIASIINEYFLKKGKKHDNHKEKDYVEKMIINKQVKRLVDM